MPVEQYQVIPLVINTGKIPLINHAVDAPIHYFKPNSENRVTVGYNTGQYLNIHNHDYRTTTQPNQKTYSVAQIDKQPTKKYNAPTTIYSETRVEGQPSLQRYSYDYKIINGNVGDNSNDQVLKNDDYEVPESYILAESDTIKKISEYNANSKTKLRRVIQREKSHKGHEEDKITLSKALKPIVVRPDPKTVNTELKKHYKNTTNSEKSIIATNQNGK